MKKEKMYQNLISKFNNKVWRHVKKKFFKKRKMLMLPNFMCHNTSHKGHNMIHKFIYSQTQDSLVTMLTIANKKCITCYSG